MKKLLKLLANALLVSFFWNANLSLNTKTFDVEAEKKRNVLPFIKKIFDSNNKIIQSFVVSKNETVYVATDHEIYKFEIIAASKIWKNDDEKILSIGINNLNGYIYVASGSNNEFKKNLYISKDSGSTFEKINKTDFWIKSFAFQGNDMYIITNGSFYFSNDNGQNIEKIFDATLINTKIHALTTMSNGNICFVDNKNLYLSDDKAKTFKKITITVDVPTLRSFENIMIANETIYLATTKELFKTSCLPSIINTNEILFTKIDFDKIGLNLKKLFQMWK